MNKKEQQTLKGMPLGRCQYEMYNKGYDLKVTSGSKPYQVWLGVPELKGVPVSPHLTAHELCVWWHGWIVGSGGGVSLSGR